MTISNSDSTSPCSRRLLLISVPRTASNLLVKILNIDNQPNILTNEQHGYFFYSAFMKTSRDQKLHKPIKQWTESQKSDVRGCFQESLDRLEEYSAQATRENKMLFVKEHAFWIYNPAAFDKMRREAETSNNQEQEQQQQEQKHFDSFRVRIPDIYGPSQTFSSSNETVLPDSYLRTWQLAFIIRHPALAWPSMYRAMLKISAAGFIDDDGVQGASLTNMSLRWTRMLYDWCLEQPDVARAPPLIIDAQEVIHNPRAVMQFCERVGLDTSLVQFEWGGEEGKKRSENWQTVMPKVDNTDTNDNGNNDNKQNDIHRIAVSIMLSTLEDSTGIVKDKTPATVDIAAEALKWRDEFGEEVAQLIEKAVWDSMPDYEYLKALCITV